MGFVTTPKTADPIVFPCDGLWHTFRSVLIPGDASEPVFSGYYVNLSGHFTKGQTTGKIEVRALRNGITEGKVGFDETGIDTVNLEWDYFDEAAGLYYFKHRISDGFTWAKNFTSLAWQIRSLRRMNDMKIKEGYYAKGTDFDQ